MIEEVGWVIERAETKPEIMMYFGFHIDVIQGVEIKGWSWYTDNLKATRFSRRIDAELAWQCVTQSGLEHVDISEHMWSDYSHRWHARLGLECCSECGIVRRADDKNGPCRGPIRVTLREEKAQSDAP